MDLEQADWLFRNLYFTGSYRDYMQTTPIILSQLEARQRRQFADNNVISHPDNEAAYRASLREDLEASQIFDFIDPERSVSVLGPSEQLQDKFQNDAAETVRKLLSRGINVILTGTPDYLGRMISMAEELKDAGHLIVVQHITDPKPRMPEVSQRTSLVRFRNSNIMNMAMINGAYYYMAYPGFLNDDFTLEVVTAMQTLKLEERDLVQISPGNLHDPFRRIVNALKAHETINPEDRKLIQYENRGRGALRIFAAQGLFDHTSPPRQLHYIKEPELHNKGEKPEKKNMDLIMIECLLRPVLGRDHASRVSKALVALGVTPAFVAKERERILAAHPEEGAKYKESRSHYGPSILNFALLLALKANALGIPLGAPIDAFFPERAQEGPHYTAELLALLESGTGRSRKELMEEMKRLIGAQREEELEGVAG